MTRQIPLPQNKPPRLGDYPFDMVEVVCHKCGRAGRYGIAGLIQEHGRECTFLELRAVFTKTCYKTNDITRLNEVCGVSFPDLLRWQLPHLAGALR